MNVAIITPTLTTRAEKRRPLPRSYPFSDAPLPFGKLFLWQPDYREFCCSQETAEWLLAGGMTHLDGLPVRLQIMDTLVGGHNVMVKVWDAPALLDSAREIQAEQWVAA